MSINSEGVYLYILIKKSRLHIHIYPMSFVLQNKYC